jgi:hypothetical protein
MLSIILLISLILLLSFSLPNTADDDKYDEYGKDYDYYKKNKPK